MSEKNSHEVKSDKAVLCHVTFSGLMRISTSILETLKPDLIRGRGKSIDRSLVPELKENDLEEKFIKGEGPGGQNVNKRNSCVYLVHKPTGLTVKIGFSREQNMNRKLARQKMITLLDNLINKEKSVESQKMQILQEKFKNRVQKQKKLHEKKKAWKEKMAGYSESSG